MVKYSARRIRNFNTTIFAEMTALANKYKAINLGQGFPDFAAPDFVKAAAREAIKNNINQYTPGNGLASLRQAIGRKMESQRRLFYDPATDITVTNGATEAIFCSIMGLVNPGDEVIVFEPYYDSYLPSIQIAGGKPRYYTLKQPDWKIDEEKFSSLFSTRTKLILINTPHNPTGKVFSLEELKLIASLCIKYDVIAITDEVYEHIIFDGLTHISMASIPGMHNRTVTISSLGKTFCVTGWKIGWAIAQPELIQAIFRTHQYITYCSAAPLQQAAVEALNTSEQYYSDLKNTYFKKRELLSGALSQAGLIPIIPQGTFFILADISELGFNNDREFCQFLTKKIRVAAIPPSAFYHNPEDGFRLTRFAFCKTTSVIQEAARRLKKIRTAI